MKTLKFHAGLRKRRVLPQPEPDTDEVGASLQSGKKIWVWSKKQNKTNYQFSYV